MRKITQQIQVQQALSNQHKQPLSKEFKDCYSNYSKQFNNLCNNYNKHSQELFPV